MSTPTTFEARSAWRRSGEVETHQPTISAAERRARARAQASRAKVVESLPSVDASNGSVHRALPTPSARQSVAAASRSASRNKPGIKPTRKPARKQTEKPSKQASPADEVSISEPADEAPKTDTPAVRRNADGKFASTGATTAILALLRERGALTVGEIIAALPEVPQASVYGLMHQARVRGYVVQDVHGGPYRHPDSPSHTDQVAGLSRLVKQLRDERDALQCENASLRARIHAAQSALQDR